VTLRACSLHPTSPRVPQPAHRCPSPRSRRRPRAALPVALVFLGVLASGCAPYSARLADLRPSLAEAHYDVALATLEKNRGDNTQLLYWLERGLVLHYADRFTESNEAFQQAEVLADDLYTKSISEGAISLITSDESIAYRARPYEMAMVPYFRALNYIYLGQRDEALVEARKASQLLARYVDATLQGLEDKEKADAFERTKNDAFLLYFSGMLYDWDAEINDAFIAYRNAALAYQTNAGPLGLEIPPSLAHDLLRTGRRLGFQDELAQLGKSAPAVFAAAGLDSAAAAAVDVSWPAGHGEVVLLLEVGYVPQKTQVRVDIPIFEGEAYNDKDYWAWQISAGMGDMQAFVKGRKVAYWLTIALPQMPVAPPEVAGARVAAGSLASHATTIRAQNVAAVAKVTFDAEYGSILLKTIIRGLTKYFATAQAEKADKWVGLAANIFGSVTERADTRSWLTLPANVQQARLTLPAGTYDLEVELVDARGHSLGTRTVEGVTVRSGDWTFLNRRVF
jgi:hypothetical protein